MPNRDFLPREQSATAVPLGILLGIFALLALGGGASRSSALSLLYVRPALLLGLLVLLTLPHRMDMRGIRPFLILLGLFAGWMLIQLVPLPNGLWRALPGHDSWIAADMLTGGRPWRPIALDPDPTLNALIALLTPLAVLVALGMMSRDARSVAPAIIIAISTAAALVGLVQVATNSGPFYAVSFPSPSGLFANRNHQALLLAVGIPFAALWATRRDALQLPQAARAGAGALCILLLAGMIVVTGSRAGLLLGLVGILSLPLVIPSRYLRGRHARLAAMAVAATMLFVGVILYFGRAQAIDRLFAMQSLSAEARVEYLPVTWSILRDFFPFGTGVSVFDPIYRAYEPDAALHTTYFNRAHNDWLELVLGGGLVAGALLTALVAILLRAVARGVADPDARPWIAAGGAALLQIALASLVDYPLRTPLMAGIFTLVAVLVAAPPAALPRNRRAPRPDGRG